MAHQTIIFSEEDIWSIHYRNSFYGLQLELWGIGGNIATLDELALPYIQLNQKVAQESMQDVGSAHEATLFICDYVAYPPGTWSPHPNGPVFWNFSLYKKVFSQSL